MKEIKPTAFYRWIMKIAKGREDTIVQHLIFEAVNNANSQVFDLLEATGEKSYSKETFSKAAKILIETMKE